ncbi:hypothetical protein AB6O49_34875 [Streptomyces sp. SBR177]
MSIGDMPTARITTDVVGKERPMWPTRWWVPEGRRGDQPPPPLLLVFNRIGPRNPGTVIAQLAELTERHWKGTWYKGGFHMYDGKLPIVVTDMKQLKEHGPAGAVFRRFCRPHNQTLLEAIGNPRREAHDARQQAWYAARQREHQEELRRIAAQHRAERPAVRCVPTAAPGSPTNGGRPSSPPGGAPRARPTRTCATTASSAPTPPNAKPSKPSKDTNNRTRAYPSRRAVAGCPASLPEVTGLATSKAQLGRLADEPMSRF